MIEENLEENLFKIFSEISVDNNDHGGKLQLLKLIIEKQEELKGKETTYTRPYATITSRFQKIEIEIEENILKLTMDWKNKKGLEKGLEFTFDINDLDIVVDRQSINFFQNLNLGENFTKRISIYF